MAIFGLGKKEEKKVTPKKEGVKAAKAPKADAPVKTQSQSTTVAMDVIIRPRVTEKASVVTANNCYVFEVRPSATKPEISRAIEALYSVKPRKIAIVRLPRKNLTSASRGGITGRTKLVKKAYVYLPEGKTIELV